MITARKLKDWVSLLPDDTTIGIYEEGSWWSIYQSLKVMSMGTNHPLSQYPELVIDSREADDAGEDI